MFVRGDRSRQGLGTRILELCEEAARAEGFTRLTLMATLPGAPLKVPKNRQKWGL
jgi:GNAT superfamily N-acetyltransferase